MKTEDRILQWQVVCFHLACGHKIDSWEAINLYGITRLSAVIAQCEENGCIIIHDRQNKRGKRWGQCSIAVYSMPKEEQERQMTMRSDLFTKITQEWGVRK